MRQGVMRDVDDERDRRGCSSLEERDSKAQPFSRDHLGNNHGEFS